MNLNQAAERSNEAWLAELRSDTREAALADLRVLLVRGLVFTLVHRIDTAVEPLAEDFAQEALLKILDNLDSFRGESKFTTWAQKIAVRVAMAEMRRKRWQDQSLEKLTTAADGTLFEPAFMASGDPSPEERTSQHGMLRLIQRLIYEELTDRQREAMLAVLVHGEPLDMVADRLGTNRNALYKLMHDARLKLKNRLLAESLTPQEVLAVFEATG